MLGWARKLLGLGGAVKTAAPTPRVRGRYENAQHTDENARSWSMVDYLSAKSANNFQVRRQLRLRSRYEVSNNPYLFGVCNGNADDLIGTGPTLKCLLPSEAANRRIEAAWNEWAQEVELVEKLRTLKLARTVDGEGFLVLKTVTDLEHSVKLYPVDVEADQVTTTMPRDLAELWVDGLILHPVTGRPVAYTVLRHHPGDFFFPGMSPLATDRIRARFVIHWFQKFRPGQVRGVPAFTTALDLFSELRDFRKAVLAKARIAANLTAVLESEAPADAEGTTTPTPFDNVPIDRGTMTTLPAGSKLHQYDTGEPGTTYEQFQEKCLGEAVRPLAYPLNLALGTSQKFNFSSAKLDHINYRNALDVERADCGRAALDPLAAAWVDEAVMIPDLLPRGINRLADVPHEWHWPGHAPLDPKVDADTDHARLAGGSLTWRQFWASRGHDWRDMLRQQAVEKDEIEKLGLVFGAPLTKTETVDDADAQGKPPGGKPGAPPKKKDATAAGGKFRRVNRLRSAWSEDEHPRDDDGKFDEGGGEHIDDRHEREAGELDQRHSREWEELDSRGIGDTDPEGEALLDRQRGEQDALDERHEAEQREHTAIEKFHTREAARLEKQQEREERQVGRQDEKDQKALDRQQDRERAAFDRERNAAIDADSREADRESAAIDARRAKEDAEAPPTPERLGERDREDDAFRKKWEEDSVEEFNKTWDTKEETLEQKHADEQAALLKQQQLAWAELARRHAKQKADMEERHGEELAAIGRKSRPKAAALPEGQ